jgi:uncharacterized protein YkwD
MRQAKHLRRMLIASALSLTFLQGFGTNKIQAEQPLLSITSIAEQYLLSAANHERVSRGMQPLQSDPILAQAAQFHAQQMADHADISHGFPGEPDLAARAATAGVRFSLISENVGEAPDSIQIHSMWMESEGHRENLLDPNVNIAGISVIVRDHQLYAVEDFASTVPTLTINQQESTVSTLVADSGVSVANDLAAEVAEAAIHSARETCAAGVGYVGARKPWFVMRYAASSLTKLPTTLQSKLGSGRYHQAAVGACSLTTSGPFTSYNIAVLLYP